jgi:hypothetical protein
MGTGFFQRTVNFQCRPFQFGNLFRPDIRRVPLGSQLTGWQLLTYMEELFQVTSISSFCMFFPFANVTALTEEVLPFVGDFYVIRQRKEFADGSI